MWTYLRPRDVLNQGITVQAWILWHYIDLRDFRIDWDDFDVRR